MALARIISRFPEESRELAENLRSRGFEVETGFPGTTAAQPADVQITIEERDAEEALQRASAAKDAYAFVMPGAITGAALPITAIPFIPPMAAPENESAEAETRRAGPEVENLPPHAFGTELSWADSREAPATPISDLESRTSVEEDAGAMILQPDHPEAQPVSEGEQPNLISMSSDPIVAETQVRADAPEPQLVSDLHEHPVEAGEQSSDVPAVEPMAFEGVEAEEDHAVEFDISGAEESQQPPILAGDFDVRSQVMKAEEEVVSAGEELHPGSFDELTEPISASAGSPQPHNEFATEVSISSETASPTGIEAPQAPVQELPPSPGALPVSDWPIWQPLSAEEAARAATMPVQKTQLVASSGQIVDSPTPLFQPGLMPEFPNGKVRKTLVPRHPLFASEKAFWRTATLAGIGALVLLLALSAHRLSPLPASLQERSADLKGPQTRPAAAAPVDLKPVTRQSRTRNKAPRPAKSADSVSTSPATAATKVNLVSSKQPIIGSADSGVNDTDIAEDTVIRYGQSGSAAVAPSQKKPAVKLNSDLN
jgi:hypothetical protein